MASACSGTQSRLTVAHAGPRRRRGPAVEEPAARRHRRETAAALLLAAVAEDIGVDAQTLVDALVEAWSPAVDTVPAAGEITEAEAEQYRAALAEAFTFRITRDGEEETLTVSGLRA